MDKTRNLTVVAVCSNCHKSFNIKVNYEGYNTWKSGNGPVIQRAMPYLTAEERELLMGGMCTECWDEVMIDWDYCEPTFLAYYRIQIKGDYNMETQAEEVARILDIDIDDYKWFQKKYPIMKKHFATECNKIDKEILTELNK